VTSSFLQSHLHVKSLRVSFQLANSLQVNVNYSCHNKEIIVLGCFIPPSSAILKEVKRKFWQW